MAIDSKRRDITVEEYHRMADAGIFGPEERVELIDGELIEMPPIGNSHWSRHAVITHYLQGKLGDRAFVVPQGSFPLNRWSEPQPDIAVLAPRDYSVRGPNSPEEILAFVEIAVSSLGFDVGRKRRLYASSGIREYLVVDIGENRLLRYTEPSELAYESEQRLGYGDRFALIAVPSVSLEADPFLARR